MRRLSLAAALTIASISPLLAQAVAPISAVAQQKNLNDATFADVEWRIAVVRDKNGYTYGGFHKQTKRWIYISNGSVSGTPSRRVYTWNNRGTLYQVTWQPADPGFARILVKTPSGEALNRLLTRT
jgi:opacity protein-like surface antigen